MEKQNREITSEWFGVRKRRELLFSLRNILVHDLVTSKRNAVQSDLSEV